MSAVPAVVKAGDWTIIPLRHGVPERSRSMVRVERRDVAGLRVMCLHFAFCRRKCPSGLSGIQIALTMSVKPLL